MAAVGDANPWRRGRKTRKGWKNPWRVVSGDSSAIEMKLSRGKTVVFDSIHLAKVRKRTWHAKLGHGKVWYARTNRLKGETGPKGPKMSHFLHGDPLLGMQKLHYDGNGLNERRANVRDGTAKENANERRTPESSQTGECGVLRTSMFTVRYKLNGRESKRVFSYRDNNRGTKQAEAQTCAAQLHQQIGIQFAYVEERTFFQVRLSENGKRKFFGEFSFRAAGDEGTARAEAIKRRDEVQARTGSRNGKIE